MLWHALCGYIYGVYLVGGLLVLPDLVLVVVLPQVLLQGLGDWQVTDVAVGLQLVAHGTAS